MNDYLTTIIVVLIKEQKWEANTRNLVSVKNGINTEYCVCMCASLFACMYVCVCMCLCI